MKKKEMKYRNTGKIVRKQYSDKGGNWTRISNEILQSKNLTAKQKSILVHLLSLKSDWALRKTSFHTQMKMGRDAFRATFNELVNLGYITVDEYTTGNTKTYHYTIYEEPIPVKLDSSNTESKSNGELGSIERTELKRTDTESISLETININNELNDQDIGPNILGPGNQTLTQQNDFLLNRINEIDSQLRTATILGTNIFNYMNTEKMEDLEKKIGNEELKKLIPMFEKRNQAIKDFNDYINSL
jgi:hypothetical protein